LLYKELGKGKLSIEFEFLQEYKAAIKTNNNIKRFFNLLRVNFMLNEKENQVQWVLN
jgi:hypothetical protein